MEPRKSVALHPSRSVELDLPKDAAFARCKRGIEDVLGGEIRDERAGEWIEAPFGLIDSERLACTLTTIDPSHTRVTIETRRGARPEAPPSSYVSALAKYLTG